ncbi:hypothetical protein BVRB_7g177520 [Beta vulgaris subsp. vulgaris]|uniref:Uncharacterized protein n=1 Tax=Beta vulgaris subsp. vulgaris TaxID=3555 RepID=A0A0J8E261_BETVV|nr:uncharacterized protein LOC104908644 [Beta vulgaris subsp. vulgaris]KMS97200.1 hypothetical protein BVRB_7g177520 [Beta vulgaris subsp. vulgaris]
MATRVSIWTIILVAMVPCLLFFYFGDPQLQEILGKSYIFSSRASHYWNALKLPNIPRFFYFFLPSHIEKNGAQLRPNIEANRGEEREKSKVIEAAEESLAKTQSMMEESAKSAAEVAGEAVHRAADMVKESLSTSTPEVRRPRCEL